MRSKAPPVDLRLTLTLAGALLLSGCASSQVATTSSIVTPFAASATSVPPPGYLLSADELDYDCKKLTGRMQVRILEIRDYDERTRSTLASRALHSAVTGILGGTDAGKDPDGTVAKDRAMLIAYNKQLVAKGCKSFDLEAELKPKDVKVTPTPSIAAPTKAETAKPAGEISRLGADVSG